jgi:hypothetical protein
MPRMDEPPALRDRFADPAEWHDFARLHDHPQPGEPAPIACPPWCRLERDLGAIEARHGYYRDERHPGGAWTRSHVSANGRIWIDQLEIRRGDSVEYAPAYVQVDVESQQLDARQARMLAAELLNAADQLDAL